MKKSPYFHFSNAFMSVVCVFYAMNSSLFFHIKMSDKLIGIINVSDSLMQ